MQFVDPLIPRKCRILVVDDSQFERVQITRRVQLDGAEFLEAVDAREAIQIARTQSPDLILLDVNLPDVSGFEVLATLKEDPATQSIPVIFLSGYDSTANKVKGLELGAIDYVAKPFDPPELRARIRVGLRLKQYHDMLEKQAYLDALTGLANRHALEHRLNAEWAACGRRATQLSLMIIDIDFFKRVNDTHGHAAGDATLQRMAAALGAVARSSDLVARYGGEEFVLVAPDCDMMGALALAERIRAQVESLSLTFDDSRLKVTASVGVASATVPILRSDATPMFLLNRADRALYDAKSAGRNTVWAWAASDTRPCWAPLINSLVRSV